MTRWTWMGALAGVFVVVTTGCASVPAGGRVMSGGAAEKVGQPDEPYVRVVPVSPLGRKWLPEQMVTGFLTASASFDDGHKVAREYLAPGVKWTPDPLPSVLVTADRPVIGSPVKNADGSTTVEVSAEQLGRIGADGQYTAEPQPLTEDFTLTQNNKGEWLISRLPDDLAGGLLLSQQDMQRAFRTRNLYFFAPDGKALVPDPVFLPLTSPADLPSQIVRAQLKGPTDWLAGAVITRFPAGAQLLGGVDVSSDGVATVNLSKEAAKGDQSGMSAQLMWALGQITEIKHLRLEIDGHTVRASPEVDTVQSPKDWASVGPDEALADAGPVLQAYLADEAGHLAVFSTGSSTVTKVQTQSRLVSSPALAFDRRQIAALSPDSGTLLVGDVYAQNSLTPVKQARSGAHFVRPSWDRNGNLWTVETGPAGSWLWLKQPGRPPAEVPGWALQTAQISAFRVALDGVRAAAIIADGKGKGMIVLGRISKDKTGRLTADTFLPITSTKIDDAIDLTWIDADHLGVLARAEGAAQPQPYNLPVGGGSAFPIGTGTPGGMRTITAAPGSPVLVGQQAPAQGVTESKLCWLRDPNDTLYSEWDCPTPGTAPVYPG